VSFLPLGFVGDLPQQAPGHQPMAAAPDDRSAVKPAEQARKLRVRLRLQAVVVDEESQRVVGKTVASGRRCSSM
jgi:hypothetical protein